MALKSVFKTHDMISKTLLKSCAKNEIIFMANIRCISNTPKQTQMTNLQYRPNFQPKNKLDLPKNMILRHCSPSPTIAMLDGMVDSVSMTRFQRPLALIFSWMLAKDKHLEKYRQMWFRRGFDVLTVRTSPIDLLLPPIGGRVVAKKLVKSLTELSSEYNEIVIHAFSVGGYQCGETLHQLRAQEEYKDILQSIKGMILDSMVFTRDCAPGLSRAITLHPVVQPMIESSINVFLKLFHNISVKNYERVEEIMFNPVAKYPGLMLYSEDDVVSSVKSYEELMKMWSKSGNRVRSKCWTNSTHVLHYRDHRSEYEEELDVFIKSLKLRDNRL